MDIGLTIAWATCVFMFLVCVVPLGVLSLAWVTKKRQPR